MSLFEFIGSRFRKLILERRSKALERPETITMIPGPVVINDLPPEILAEIFVLAIEFIPLGRDIDINDHYGILNIRRSGPLNLVHVCRYWREVALSMQTLWASFDATRFTPKGWAYWSSFSGTSPLRLDFHPDPSLRSARGTNEDKHGWERWRPGVDNTKLKKLKEMLRQFSACADRWDCLYFDCEYYQVTEAIADMLQTTASRSPLRNFEIILSSHDTTPPEVIDKLVSAIASFPSLRQFVWESTGRHSTLPRGPRPFPWHVLENVYLSVGARVELLACIQCLMQCTSARNITLLRRGKGDITGTFELVHTTLPKLESLTIDEDCDPYIFLGYFTLPSLVSLEIQTLGSFSPVLQEFLVRSQCPLRTFKFTRGYGMKSDEIVECLSTPYLRTVPNVFASINLLPIPYLHDVVHKRSDILHTLPGFAVWPDEETSHTSIGWRSLKAS